MAPVHPKDVVAYRAEYSALLDLCPSIQLPKPVVLTEVLDQVNNSKLRQYICHTMTLGAPDIVQVRVNIP